MKRTGAPLGVQKETPYAPANAIDLSPGDLVLLPTDGMEEAISPEDELFGTDRLLEVARAHRHESARQVLDALFAAVRSFSKEQPQSDDLTVVGLEMMA